MGPEIWAFVAFGAVSALTTVVCALYVYFSGPVAGSRLLRDWLERLEEVETSWRTKTIEITGLLDSVARDFEHVVRARNRLTALEAKATKRDEAAAAEEGGAPGGYLLLSPFRLLSFR